MLPCSSFRMIFRMAWAYRFQTSWVMKGGSASTKSKELWYCSGMFSGWLKSYWKKLGLFLANLASNWVRMGVRRRGRGVSSGWGCRWRSRCWVWRGSSSVRKGGLGWRGRGWSCWSTSIGWSRRFPWSLAGIVWPYFTWVCLNYCKRTARPTLVYAWLILYGLSMLLNLPKDKLLSNFDFYS